MQLHVQNAHVSKDGDMKVIGQVLTATVAIVLAATTNVAFAKNANGRRIQITGECAKYFRGGKQVRAIHGSRRCSFVAKVSGLALSESGGVELTISRRFTAAASILKTSVKSTVINRRHSYSPDPNGKISGSFLVHGNKGLSRYTLKLPPVSDLTDILPSCSELTDAIEVEGSFIRSCTQDSDCGQVLSGTSCGCTRNLIARNDADVSQYYRLIDQAVSQECSEALPISTCDCPQVTGVGCHQGICGWNYVPSSEVPFGGNIDVTN